MDTKKLLQIKVKISDKSVLERLTPEMVILYLSRNGWKKHRQEYANPHGTNWQKGNEWLLVPMDHNQRDYTIRISSVIREVAELEERSELAVYVDILEGS